MDKYMITNYLGIETEDWWKIKELIDNYYSGDVARFILGVYDDKSTVRSLHLKVDRLQREVAEQKDRISNLRKYRNQLKEEIAEMKLPLLVPIMQTDITCKSFDSTGYRCQGADSMGINKRNWCMLCKCYDPE